ncbi:claudin-23-like [Hoplias malabaricus]|uniref:claudin-23-like n=1 Tax=Hoplias malabaricus TaxID=27720 RepID=UPI003461D6D4
MEACRERCVVRVPAIVILGLSLTPCGWIMVLTSMVVPHWRTVHNITGKDPDLILWQGLWDICHYYLDSADMVCNNQDEAYFDHRIIDTAQRMMAFSLLLTLIGLAVTVFGVRCWTVRPKWTAVCLGGFVIVCSGLLSIMPVAWYGHLLNDIDSPSPEVRLGFCIIFGYLGGILEVLGGFLLFVATWRYNGNGLNPSLSPQTENHQNLWQITVPSVTGGVGNNCSNPKQSLENNM